MSDTKKNRVAEQLEMLKGRFRDRAVEDLRKLEGIVCRIQAGAFTCDDVSELYHSLHRLAGSAGTFGYTPLGREARLLENLIRPVAEPAPESKAPEDADHLIGTVVTPEFARRISGLIALLEEAPPLARHTDIQVPVAVAESRDEPEILIVDGNLPRARALAGDLELHGFQSVVSPALEERVQGPEGGFSAILIRDHLVTGDAEPELPEAFGNAPVICIGSEDTFAERYMLAERGVDGFICDPVDVPFLADYIERLINEREENGTGRVMIVDDDRELLEHYGLVLESGGLEVRWVDDPTRILSVLSEFRPDMVLMDVQMGRFSGPNLVRMLRFDPEWLGLPIVYLSSEDDREFQVEALAKGGDEFLTKPVSDDFLLRAVTVRCYRARQLDKLASRDGLTGLLKHSVAKQEIQMEHARCQRTGQESVVAMLDLDHFKQVNDRYGHRTGDMVIKGMANLLRHRLRKSDIIGRYGGEEFVVALPDCSVANARTIMESICEQVSRIVFTGAGKEFSITMSVGIAPLHRFDSSGDAIEAADQALYQRKQSGRNGVTLSGYDIADMV